jgi:hypothetical protein
MLEKNNNLIQIFSKHMDSLFIEDLYSFMQKNKQKEANSLLVGNIINEYDLTSFIPRIEKELIGDINKNPELQDIIKMKSPLKNYSLKIEEMWINFQKKYEFNPLHNHAGLFSFIIFIHIPIDSKKELEISPGRLSKSNLAGCLQFVYYDSMGNMVLHKVAPEQQTINTLLLFPAELHHIVYPFFSTDDARVTVAGNIYYR